MAKKSHQRTRPDPPEILSMSRHLDMTDSKDICFQPKAGAWHGFRSCKVYHGAETVVTRQVTSAYRGGVPSAPWGGEKWVHLKKKTSRVLHPQHPGTAEIAIEGAEDLYREIRVENALKNEKGEKVALKEGASGRCDY